MPTSKIIKTLIDKGQLPKKDFNGELSSIEEKDTENAVSPPFYAPTINAEVFFRNGNKTQPYFRISESEKAYSKSMLKKEFGIPESITELIPHHQVAYSHKKRKHFKTYTLSKLKSETPPCENFNEWFTKLRPLLENKDGHVGHDSYKSKLFNIHTLGREIRVDFHGLKLTVHCKGKLIKFCNDNLTSIGAFPLLDFKEQIIEPLAKNLTEILNRNYEKFKHLNMKSHSRIDVRTLDPRELEFEIQDFIEITTEEQIQELTYSAMVSNKPYHELFPCREITRKIKVYIAPTNSGKTYQSCNDIKKIINENPQANATCLFPLRALAAQVKDDFVKDGFSCDLITGEEREIEKGSRITSCTTETIDPSTYTNTIFIDECQLIFDDNKQAAYTRAILGAYCDNLILAVAPMYAKALIKVLKKFTNDEIEVVELKRLCPLKVIGKIDTTQLEKGDVVVAYRVKTIHQLADKIKKQGLKVGVIYGKMSPSARRAMIREFMNKDCDVLIATDAIGMGISIPAKRVFIAEGTKFDGKVIRDLLPEEIRQVAGRAGRFGFYDVGYAGVLKSDIVNEEKQLSVDSLREAVENIEDYMANNKLKISPDRHVIASAKDLTLTTALEVWSRAVTSHKNIEISEESYGSLLSKAIFIDKNGFEDRKLAINLMFIVYPDDKAGSWSNIYQEMVKKAFKGETLEGFDWEKYIMSSNFFDNFSELEDKSIFLTMMSQFQRIVPELTPHEAYISMEQEKTGEDLAKALLEKYTPNVSRNFKSKNYAERVLNRLIKRQANGDSDFDIENHIKESITSPKQKSDFISASLLRSKDIHTIAERVL